MVLANFVLAAFGSVGAQSVQDLKTQNAHVRSLYDQGKYDEAIPLALDAVAFGEKKVGIDLHDQCISLDNLALLYLAKERYAESESEFKKALEIRTDALGTEHPDVAKSLNWLGLLHKIQRRYDDAEPLYRRSLEIREKALGADHADVGQSLRNLASLFNAQGRYSEAIPLFSRSLRIVERELGPDSEELRDYLNFLGSLYEKSGQRVLAGPLYTRDDALLELTIAKGLGANHPRVAEALFKLARTYGTTASGKLYADQLYAKGRAIEQLSLRLDGAPGSESIQSDPELQALSQRLVELYHLGKYEEAIPSAERFAEVTQARKGSDHGDYATALYNLGQLLQRTKQESNAEALYRRALAIAEKHYGPEHFTVGGHLANLADLLKGAFRYSEAELMMRRALLIAEKSLGPEHSLVATRLNDLALLLRAANSLSEAEPMMRRALEINEKSLGPDSLNVATSLTNLALLLEDANRDNEAEHLHRRALAIAEKSQGLEHREVAPYLENLAGFYAVQGRYAEAELLQRRALVMHENFFGPEHPNVASSLNSLGTLLKRTDRLSEAEPMMRRAVAIGGKYYGPEHPIVAIYLSDLALLLKDESRFGEAESMLRRALAMYEKNLDPAHPRIASTLTNLVTLRAEQGDWAEAAVLAARVKPIMVSRKNLQGGDRSNFNKAALTRNAIVFRDHARVLHRAAAHSTQARSDGFELAQWALQTGAADALAQMSARFAKGTGPLSILVRQRQDLVTRRRAALRNSDIAAGKADAKTADEARSAAATLDKQLDEVDVSLKASFPEYVELSNPSPLTAAGLQALLRPNEALVLFLDVPQIGRLPGETLTWVVTKNEVRWRSIPVGTQALSDQVAALRCGLDSTNWETGAYWSRKTEADKQRVREQEARYERCKRLTGKDVSPAALPPFDLAKAHQLYQALLEPFAEVIHGKHLIIVPSGPLTSLPFQVLVSVAPDPSLKGLAAYKKAAWLALRQPITVLPSVSSLQVLRKLEPSRARAPYIAFGNPLLSGPDGRDKRAWDKQICKSIAAPILVVDNKRSSEGGVALRTLNPAQARAQPPLPETADELCAVANAQGALTAQAETVWLGGRATETNVKALSRAGKLSRYRVVHFATHGLLSGESERVLSVKAEPALLLTPPPDNVTSAELDEDDGLLTASEVAKLELDADWVVLSACNTAAGEHGDAEPLAGLSRAFFYAKARALLVSHWDVSSSSTVKLTTRAFEQLARHRGIGRAEALRRSMVNLIKTGKPEESHPTNWAAFVLVGDDGG